MDKKEREKNRLINNLVDALSENNLAIFAGAGLSIPAGFVNWSQLLKPIADELDLDITKENDLVTLAQYHCNMNQSNRGKLNQLLVNAFSKDTEITDNHKILARLPIRTYWTTNYDKLIETALSKAGKIADTKYTNKQLVFTKPKRDAIVYKMHGDVDHPSEAVLTKDDYETYHLKMQPFLNALSGDLISKTFLFLGFSFTDPNLDYILSRVRIAYNSDQRPHYCILKLVAQYKDEAQADFEYRGRKQELFVQDLLRFGIKSILVDDYSEVTEIIARVENQYKQKSIFISGAAHEYGRFEKNEVEVFVYELSKSIVESGYKVVSGFGLGIGSAVITGVLESVYMNGNRLDDSQLLLRPFPQSNIGNEDIKVLWKHYREDMISYAGIALFLFGNKLVDGKVELSDGMKQEFEIAKGQGILLIPIGATGYMAKELWDIVIESFKDEYKDIPQSVKDKIIDLGNESKSLDEIKQIVLDIINLLNGGQ
ncbi:MAG: hypothetical protein COA44_12960 [Arcobacter sp.]|nr:MAG: hypothetical protein COA44_12960 [Arcobacter sp.]